MHASQTPRARSLALEVRRVLLPSIRVRIGRLDVRARLAPLAPASRGVLHRLRRGGRLPAPPKAERARSGAPKVHARHALAEASSAAAAAPPRFARWPTGARRGRGRLGLAAVGDGERRGEDVRRVDVVRLAAVPRDAVHADLDFRRVAEVRFVEVLGRDLEGGELGEGGGRAEAALFDVLDFVV